MRKTPLPPSEQDKFDDKAEKISLGGDEDLHIEPPLPIFIEGLPEETDQASDASLSERSSGSVPCLDNQISSSAGPPSPERERTSNA